MMVWEVSTHVEGMIRIVTMYSMRDQNNLFTYKRDTHILV